MRYFIYFIVAIFLLALGFNACKSCRKKIKETEVTVDSATDVTVSIPAPQETEPEFETEPVSDIAVTVIGEYTYTGEPIEPTVTIKAGDVTLTEGTDYTLSYYDNTDAGTATVAAIGAGAYAGKRAMADFTINPLATTFVVTVSGTYTYSKAAIEPSDNNVTVMWGEAPLIFDTDYTLDYSDNVNAGQATVTATGAGNFAGSGGEVNFIIAKRPITVTANNTGRSIWDSDPALTYSVTPALFGDDALAGTLTRVAGTALRTYNINQGNLAGGANYEIASFNAGVFSIYHFKGEGLSAATAYEISTPAQLAGIAEFVNTNNAAYIDKYYKLTDDINLSAYGASWNGGKGWIPIGTHDSPFKGNFDGNNRKVNELYINDSSLNYAGLFGIINDGSVRNLSVDGTVIGDNFVGSLAGVVDNGGSITNCYATGTVNGDYGVGGLAGVVDNGGSITNCYATGEINGGFGVGGLVGIVDNGSITNCYATGAISGEWFVGGLAGNVNGSVTNCYATGAISGRRFVGGLAGVVYGSITNCAALNQSITRSGSDMRFGRVAGFIGGTITNNTAWADMEAIRITFFGPGAANNQDGTDITTATIRADGAIGERFNMTRGWTTQNGRLPGLFGETVEMPAHLR